MNITNLELTQAFIELIGMAICIMSVVILSYGKMDKMTKLIKTMFVLSAAMLFCDAGAYIFRGNDSPLCIFMTRICNYGNFFFNTMLLCFTCYLTYYLAELRGIKSKNILITITHAMCMADLVILIVNVFTDYMFYFDDNNYYHRNDGWYVFSAIAGVVLLINIVYTIAVNKALGRKMMYAMLFYELSPLCLAALQFLAYGVSFTAVGVVLGLIIVMYSYNFSWRKQIEEDKDSKQKRNYLLAVFTTVFILVVSMSSAILVCVNSFNTISKERSKEETRALAGMIKASIEGQIIKETYEYSETSEDYEESKDGDQTEIDFLNSLITGYDEEYDITISLTYENGLIWVSTVPRAEHDQYIDSNYYKKLSGTEAYIDEPDQNITRITYYLSDSDLYLVTTFEDNYTAVNNALPGLIIFFLGIELMVAMFFLVIRRERQAMKNSEKNKKAAVSDEMTGMMNRRAYEEDCRPDRCDMTNLVATMFDVNGLKAANDNIGHKAGDELIKGAADCINASFGKFGKVYRIGGDEFIAVSHCTEAEAQSLVKELDELCSKWSGELVKELFIAKGYARAEEYPGKTVQELVKIADKNMYADKEAYYIRTGKKRRT